MNMTECPRFERCSANACPLDDHLRVHLVGEPVCGYVAEAVKVDAEQTLRSVLPEEAAEAVMRAAPELAARYPDIAAKLAKASRTGSRIAAARRMRSVSEPEPVTPSTTTKPKPVPSLVRTPAATHSPSLRSATWPFPV